MKKKSTWLILTLILMLSITIFGVSGEIHASKVGAIDIVEKVQTEKEELVFDDTRQIGGIIEIAGVSIDLDARRLDITDANSEMISLLLTQPYTFTSASPIQIYFYGSSIYGTKQLPIKKNYDSQIRTENAYNFNIMWEDQKLRNINTYSFVNRIPDSLKIPVPFYFEECIGEGWNFIGVAPEGYTNTTVELRGLRNVFNNNMYKSYTYNSRAFEYTPLVNYTNKENVMKSTSNSGTWLFSTNLDVNYTVDIAPITKGGNPSLEGLTQIANGEVLFSNLHTANSEFWRNGDINQGIDGGSYQALNVDDSIYGNYGDAFVANGGAQPGYQVAYMEVKTYHPASGELMEIKKYNTMEEYEKDATIKGKTEIRVAYEKASDFIKADGTTKEAITQNEAQFSVYEDRECRKEIGKSTYDAETGKVKLPMMTMPEVGKAEVTYYMKESKAPNGYEMSEEVYEVKLTAEGKVTIRGKDYDTTTGKLYNYTQTKKQLGSLLIEKVNIDGNPEDEFEFIVTLGTKEQMYEGTHEVNGEVKKYTEPIKVKLKGGEKVKIGGIEEGTAYQVKEVENENYAKSSIDEEGKIEAKENKVSFTNVMKKDKALTISKSTIGMKEVEEYEFYLEMDGKAYEGEYTIAAQKDEKTYEAKNGKMYVKGGEIAIIKGLKPNTTYRYKIVEKEGAKYKLTKSENTEGSLNTGSDWVSASFLNTYQETPREMTPNKGINTGDESNMRGWMVWMGASLLVVLGIFVTNKRREN